MIVCLCRAKNERDVLRAIEAGSETLDDLLECGIGTDCGGCHNFLRKMLRANESVSACAPAGAFVPMPSPEAWSESVA
jgi:bacterioferritin-associated ferredoxin